MSLKNNELERNQLYEKGKFEKLLNDQKDELSEKHKKLEKDFKYLIYKKINRKLSSDLMSNLT